MDWEKSDQNIADHLEALIKVFLRLSASDRSMIQSECDEVKPFEPRPDFVMKEYVEIPDSKLSDNEFINKWLHISYSYVKTLPPKVKIITLDGYLNMPPAKRVQEEDGIFFTASMHRETVCLFERA